MKLSWGAWETDPTADPLNAEFLSPYVDWARITDASGRQKTDFQRLSQRGTNARPFPFTVNDLPLLHTAIRPGSTQITQLLPRQNPLAGLTVTPGRDDVIIGVIDAGIAPAHERFRRKGAIGTRILSHWVQAGNWQDQDHLPFGREMMQRDIDTLMGPTPQVDEAAFTRNAGLVDFTDPNGERWIETAAPHGTHVADLAAGCDPCTDSMATLRDRSHLITVELAPRISIGASGSFLELFAIWAIRHIVDTADAIWRAAYPVDPRKGFAMVINMSYGLHAGPKDGSMAIQKFVRILNHGRDPSAPVRIVLPAGNDNLDRGSAVFQARGKGETAAIDWRILPEDRTSSFVEVWTDPADSKTPSAAPTPIWLMPPGGPVGPVKTGKPGKTCDLLNLDTGKVMARIYCRNHDNLTGIAALDEQSTHAVGYVLCVAPTWQAGGGAALSGAWRIKLGEGQFSKLYIQSDQSVAPQKGGSLQSYFEDTAETPETLRYRSHNADGSVRDSYTLDRGTASVVDNEPWATTGPIRRQNTMNAIAGSFGVLTIAGYRASDGWPAAYSATARGFPIGGKAVDARKAPHAWADTGGGKALMEAACISDDSLWRFGRQAAGGRSGSVVALQGTSFATAEATRIIALRLLEWLDNGAQDPAPASATEVQSLAAALDAKVSGTADTVPASKLRLKLGAGRLPRQNHGRQPR